MNGVCGLKIATTRELLWLARHIVHRALPPILVINWECFFIIGVVLGVVQCVDWVIV